MRNALGRSGGAARTAAARARGVAAQTPAQRSRSASSPARSGSTGSPMS